MIIYINGFRVQVEDESRIAQTKQVNNLFDLSTRQTNFTNSIDLPMTGANIIAMEYLGIVGNNSNVPYKINTVSVFSDEGECFIHNGRCVILETTDKKYKIQFLDGNIDLYKDMANDKIGSLDLPEVKHERNLNIVKDSFTNDLPYKYIVADFNGNMSPESGKLNIDYMVPSIKVSYLWDKLFNNYGYTYSGNFFSKNDFSKLWLTYPSGVSVNQSNNIKMFESNDWYFKDHSFTEFGQLPKYGYNPYRSKGIFLSFNTASTNTLNSTPNNIAFNFKDAGKYKVKAKGKLFISPYFRDGMEYNGKPLGLSLTLGKNLQGNITRDTDATNYSDWSEIIPMRQEFLEYDSPFDKEIFINVEAGDTLHLMLKTFVDAWLLGVFYSIREFEFTIEKVSEDVIDFNTALQDFGVKEFFNEVVNRFSLVPIKSKYEKHYNFYTLDELLLSNKTAYDWSDKKPVFRGEKYLYNSYQQRNYFRLKYDEKEAEHNDGYIQIDNKNLNDKFTAYQSQLYSPEFLRSSLLNRSSNVYKLWNKEVKDDQTVTYKSLSKRFFFISYDQIQSSGTLMSEVETGEVGFNSYPAETFRGLDYSSTVSYFYRNSSVMLNKAVVMNVELMLNDVDISEIDFSRQVYLKQFASYFLINKINNYISALKPTQVELIKLGEFSPDAIVQNVITEVTTKRIGGNFVEIGVYYNKDFFPYGHVDVELIGIEQFENQPNTGFRAFNLHITRLSRDMAVKITQLDLSSEVHVFTLKI